MRGPCKTCGHWKLFVHPRDKNAHQTICTLNPPVVIALLQTAPSALVGQPPQVQSVPVFINPPTPADYECGQWEEAQAGVDPGQNEDEATPAIGISANPRNNLVLVDRDK